MNEPNQKREKEDYINVSVLRINQIRIKEFLDKYFEGAPVGAFYDKAALERMYRIEQRNTPIDILSGDKLVNMGWEKISNATYKKEESVIMYSGTRWFIDGEQITPENYHIKLGNKLKTK